VLTPRWNSAADLVWSSYDDSDDWVVFNPHSGDVHLLTASARTLWQIVDRSPRLTTMQVIDALASALSRPTDGELVAAVQDTIDFMDRAGLIAPETA